MNTYEENGFKIIDNGQGGIVKHPISPLTDEQNALERKARIERSWRDAELYRTDVLMLVPDHPQDFTVYRQALRDYPAALDFPDGSRPTI